MPKNIVFGQAGGGNVTKRITLEQGKIYHNKSGGDFLCISSHKETAVMQNVVSGWTFKANGTIQYQDNSIEWDYSTGGHFENFKRR